MAAKKRQTRRGWGRIRKLPSGRIQAGYIGPDLKTHHAPQTFSTRTDAEAWLAQERKLIDWGKWSAPRTRDERRNLSDMTVAQWLDAYFDTRRTGPNALKLSTLYSQLKVVRNRITEPNGPGAHDPRVTHLAQMPIAEVTKKDVYAWWDAINRVYPDTPPTNTSAYKRLHTAFKAAADRQIIPENPVKIAGAGKTPAPKPKYLMQDWEVHALINAAPGRYRLLTCLIFGHGLRIGEAIGLERRHLVLHKQDGQLVGATIKVEQNASRITLNGRSTMVLTDAPKTDAGYREVPLIPKFLPVVEEHLKDHVPTGKTEVTTPEGSRKVQLLSSTATGALIMDTTYRSTLSRMKRASGVSPEIHPHSGRYWLATRLMEQGATVKEAGTVLGQQDPNVTARIYLQVNERRPKALMGRIGDTFSETPAGGSW